jgi:hypothetical protein
MIKKLIAVDEKGEPVKNAVFTFTQVQADGSTGIVAVADGGQSGVVSFDTQTDPNLFSSDNHITVEAPGFLKSGVDADVIGDAWQFTMAKSASMVPALTLGALVAVGAVAIYRKGNKSKVGAFNAKDDLLPWVVPAAVVVGGYALYKKFFGKSEEDKARDQALSDDIANAQQEEPARMLDSEIAATANALVEDLTYSHPFGDSDQQLDAAHQLTKPGTLVDLLRLIKQYGKHYITYFGIPAGSFTLEETVTRKLDREIIDEINRYYRAQGINFQF